MNKYFLEITKSHSVKNRAHELVQNRFIDFNHFLVDDNGIAYVQEQLRRIISQANMNYKRCKNMDLEVLNGSKYRPDDDDICIRVVENVTLTAKIIRDEYLYNQVGDIEEGMEDPTPMTAQEADA